ncbi:MAG: hypothetical protein SFW67_06400 [Myxococcaceae bacterium]|nr:hypothetical protein [Myxococcaceae bacterium]
MTAPISRVTSGASTVSTASAARAWAEGFNFGSRTAVDRLDVPRTKAPTTGPESLQRAYAFYQSWEDNDLGSVRLLKTQANNQTVYALHTTTDGDDGFLELYSERGALLASGTTGFDSSGRRNVSWDATPGAVRERVAPRDVSPSVETFFNAIDQAKSSGSASGATISRAELRDAAKALVGSELTSASVDGWEKAGLLKVLAEGKLTSSSRTYAEQLSQLYTSAPNTTLSRFTSGTLQGSAFNRAVKTASASVNASGAPPRLNTMMELSRRAFAGELPTQVVPVTRSEAQAMLRAAGATSAEAKAAIDGLADAKGQLYAGRFFDQGADWIPKAKGLAFFGVSSTGRDLKALNVPAKTEPVTGPDARAVLKGLLGVERPVDVLATRATATGTQFDLAWTPPTGGRIQAKLDVPTDGSEATVSGLTLPSVIGMTEASLAERVSTATGSPRTGLSYAQLGNDWLVATRPQAGGPITLSKVQVALGGGSATVTNATIGTSATQLQAARQLALGLARVQAEAMVSDPSISDAARLEVALRTRWASFSDLEAVDPADSAVGFDAAKDRAQFMLGRVWGDNAAFVTFQKDGAVRLEDFN